MSEASRRRDRAWPWLALALIVLVGVVLRAIPLLRTGGLLSGIQYDDGVYLWSAALLVGGHLPYLDFTFLHPPGVILAMAPFGAIVDGGDPRNAVILGRSLMLVVAALNILLIADLGRRWRGWPTGLLAASLYAISLGAMIADATILLEPFLNLACLAALDVWLAGERTRQTARRCVLIGILLAVGLSFKLWAGVYVLVIGGVFVLRGAWRDLVWTAVGGARRRSGPRPAVRGPRTGSLHPAGARRAGCAGCRRVQDPGRPPGGDVRVRSRRDRGRCRSSGSRRPSSSSSWPGSSPGAVARSARSWPRSSPRSP